MKGELNKDRNSQKKKNPNGNSGNKNSISPIKDTLESHSSRLKQVENRSSGLKDKVDTI
jgi:hypothetical protein